MKRVLVYRGSLLSKTEGFIKNQALYLKKWEATMIGAVLSKDGMDLRPLNYQFFFRRGGVSHYFFRGLAFLGIGHWLVRRFVEDFKPEVIHAQFGTSAVEVYPSVKGLGIPILVTLRGYDIAIRRDIWESGARGWWMKRYPNQLMALASDPLVSFLAVSEDLKKRAVEFGIPEKKVEVQFNGIDVSQAPAVILEHAERRNDIVFIGRLVEKKGLSYLVKAFEKVREAVKDARLVVIGDGPQHYILDEAQRRFSREGVEITGFLEKDQVLKYLGQARVLCAPSITAEDGDSEGLPNVLLEAQLMGTPVVTSAVGASDAVQNGKTGFFHKEKDVDAIAEGICKVLYGNSGLLCAREISQFVVSRFDINRCAESLEKRYDDRLAKKS